MDGEGLLLGSGVHRLVSFKVNTLPVKAQEGACPEEEGVGRGDAGWRGDRYLPKTMSPWELVRGWLI